MTNFGAKYDIFSQLRAFLLEGNYLEDLEKTKHLAVGFFTQNWKTGRFAGALSFTKKEGELFFQLTKTTIEANINAIYQFSQSPIERIFLCSFLLDSVFTAPWCITITGPIDINTYPDRYRAQYQEADAVYTEISQRSDFDMSQFLEFLKTAPSLSEDQRKVMMHHLLFERTLDLYSNFHISLQPTIRIEERTLRPDFFLIFLFGFLLNQSSN